MFRFICEIIVVVYLLGTIAGQQRQLTEVKEDIAAIVEHEAAEALDEGEDDAIGLWDDSDDGESES